MEKITKNNVIIPSNIWGSFDIVDNQIYFWRVGNCNIWLKREEDNIYIKWFYSNSNNKIDNENIVPDDEGWSHYVIKGKSESIELSPAMPDRSLVIKVKRPFYLPPGIKKRIYIDVPLWICISTVGNNKAKLVEIPSFILSNTWFGTPIEGQVCYWLMSEVNFGIEEYSHIPYMATCPVTLKNISNENLLVKKFLIPVENSVLFIHNNELWSDEILISYKGQNDVSFVECKGHVLKEFIGAKKICEPRKKQTNKRFVRTFDSFIVKNFFNIPLNR